MKRISRAIGSLLTAGIAISMSLNFSACSKESPLSHEKSSAVQKLSGRIVQSENGPIQILGVKDIQVQGLAKPGGSKGGKQPGWMKRVYVNEKFMVADSGGVIMVGHPVQTGKTKIYFAPNDLPKDMTIRLEWAASGTLEGVLSNAQFGPHGTNFNRPVRVELSYKAADLTGVVEGDLRVYYLNETTNLWEYIGGTVNTSKQIVIAYINHFSRYALSAN